MSVFAPSQTAALRELDRAWRDTPWVIIGATALATQLDMDWRRTEDLDLAVSVGLEAYPGVLASLEGWRRDRRIEHRWRTSGDVRIDVLPAGPALLEQGSIAWPNSGAIMNLLGVDLAFDEPFGFAVTPDLEVSVATVPSVIVMKMIAYLDRPEHRERDLEDIAHVLEVYLDEADDRRLASRLYDGTVRVDFEHQCAFLLGEDVRAVTRSRHRTLVGTFLRTVSDPDSYHFGLMLRRGPWRWRDESNQLVARLAAFQQGLDGD